MGAFSRQAIERKRKRDIEELNKFLDVIVGDFLEDVFVSSLADWVTYSELFHDYEVWYKSRALHWNFNRTKRAVKADPLYFAEHFKPLEKPFEVSFSIYQPFRNLFNLK